MPEPACDSGALYLQSDRSATFSVRGEEVDSDGRARTSSPSLCSYDNYGLDGEDETSGALVTFGSLGTLVGSVC